MNMWKGNGNITTLLSSLKRHEILHQGRRAQMKTIVIEHFNGILFHKYGPANKQHTSKPTNNTVANLRVNVRSFRRKSNFDKYIRIDLEERGVNAGNWVDSAQDRNYWRALVNATLNLLVP